LNSLTNEGGQGRGFKTHGIYRHACPNCGGPISDYRLLFKAPCESCLSSSDFEDLIKKTGGKLREMNRLELFKLYSSRLRENINLKRIIREEEELEDFEKFFEKATGFKMWSAQRTWARRILKGSSFSIIAPTGMGKTVFSIIASLYITLKNKGRHKSYMVFPTTPLLLQADKKLRSFLSNLGIQACNSGNWGEDCLRILCIHGRLGKKEKELALDRLRRGDFDILLTTSAFLHKQFEVLRDLRFKFIVMDDVDAVLKSGRAVRRVLGIIGVSDEYIDKALALIKTRARLVASSGDERARLEKEVASLEEEISRVKKSIDTILIVNSATGKPRGIYPKLFKVFMNFEAGSKPEAIRNIVDTYTEPSTNIEEEVVNLALRLHNGLLIFVPVDKGVEYAEKITAMLREKGLKAEAFHAKKSIELLEEFARGDVDILVGVATYYGVIVRGIDLPERVKYVVFAGVPRHKFSSELEDLSPTDILRILTVLRDISSGERKELIERLIGRIASRMRRMSQGALVKLREAFSRKIKGEPVEETPLLRDLMDAYRIVAEELSKEETWLKISSLGDIGIVKEGNRYYMLIPDVATYIQASGRASRLYPGGITKGLSIIVVDDKRLLNGLVRRMRWIFEDFNIIPLSQVNLGELVEYIESERRKVAEILRSGITPDTRIEPVKTALLIVESPNKAKTIANFFGKPSIRVVKDLLQVYEVTVGNYVLSIVASAGHVYDLVTDKEPPEAEGGNHLYGVLTLPDRIIPIYTDIKKCSNGHQFTDEIQGSECPRCRLEGRTSRITRKLDIIDALRELAREVDVVLIGTDPDAEGEKIAWDLRVLLEPYTNSIMRIEFHEVTRKAILNALKNPRGFNVRLVESQIVRRVDDRWLGFSLSEKVQKYAWLEYCSEYLNPRNPGFNCCQPNNNLSAGRVQTPVLEYIVNETSERIHKPERRSYRLRILIGEAGEITVTLPYSEAGKAGLTELVGRKLKKPIEVEVKVVSRDSEYKINPPPPFTTDSLLEEASRVLGLSTTRAMEIAQNLFEMGLITYHRTDSTRVSEAGKSVAKQYLEEKGMSNLYEPRTWGEGGAHEAIRPTKPIDADRLMELVKEGVIVLPVRLTRDHVRLYDLIFRRFIASQMAPAIVEKTKIAINIWGVEYVFEVYTGVREKGYLELYDNIRGNILEVKLEATKPLQGEINYIEELKPPMLRFHDVVKWMKEQGVGRPSTYAKIIQTLIDRRYVMVSKKIKALIPQERGKYVLEFLKRNYGETVSVETTRKLEDLMEKISRGEADYQSILRGIYEEVKSAIIENHRVNRMLEEEYREKCSLGAASN